jgi:hypothetical protein
MMPDFEVGDKILLPEEGEPYDNPSAIREVKIISISKMGANTVFQVEGIEDVHFCLETFANFQETYKKVQRIISIWGDAHE